MIGIVILNWNGWQDTLECLNSILKQTDENYKVVIVDNASTDASKEQIRQWIGLNDLPIGRFELLCLENNLGYAIANNLGMKQLITQNDPQYLFVLNNDTVVCDGALAQMANFLENHPAVGLVGPKIFNYYKKVHDQGPLFKPIGFVDYLLYFTPLRYIMACIPFFSLPLVTSDLPQEVYALPGCSLFFNAKAVQEVGFFDEATFLGYEEYIIAEKMHKNGYKMFVVPKAKILHKVGRGTAQVDSVKKTIYFLQSEDYYQKNYLKYSGLQIFIIKTLKLIIYSFPVLFIKDYRKDYFKLISAIMFARKGG